MLSGSSVVLVIPQFGYPGSGDSKKKLIAFQESNHIPVALSGNVVFKLVYGALGSHRVLDLMLSIFNKVFKSTEITVGDSSLYGYFSGGFELICIGKAQF